jgi:hypothetical protein
MAMIRVIRTAVRVTRNGALAALAVGGCFAADAPPPPHPPPAQPAAQQTPAQPEINEEQKRAEEIAVSATEAESDADVAGEKAAPKRVRQVRDADAPEGEKEKNAAEDAQREEQHEDSNSEADTLGPPGFSLRRE